ncbi:MAG: prepilin-type N-terminal cleavage/methylation domain-containing protein [Thermodesulfovibrionales bacterium]|nr:prepilin-type N-terminal cleavage/methylation domain-containing protein [Thermodesulfovibrionales bacterium]
MRHQLANNRGFTLLEMLITIFLIIVIVGISSLFFLSRQPKEELKTAVRDMVTTVRYARSLARNTGEVKVFTIDIDNSKFGIEGRGEKPLPKETIININDPVNGLTSQGKYRIEFYPSGLSGFAQIHINSKSNKFTISLDPVIGAYVVQ